MGINPIAVPKNKKTMTLIKKILPLLTILLIMLSSACKKDEDHILTLDNQSDYEASLKIETGETTNSGAVTWKEYIIPSKDKLIIPLQDNSVYVSEYSPDDKILLEANEKTGTITIVNR